MPCWIPKLLIGLFAWSPRPAPAPAPAGPKREALVLVADGVGGFDLCGKAMARAIRASGLSYTTRTVRWGHGMGRWYADLSDAANCDARAGEVAEAVRRHRAERPGEPVFLVGKSGGCAVVVKALERLARSGESESVERAILLAPALSPGYDLTRALGGVRREVVVFWSPLDVIFLGAGTRIFGTSDRVWCSGAGRVGFLRPKPGVDAPSRSAAYKKLRQVRWSPRMSSTGYLGGHLGPDSPRFLKKYVVPLLRVETPAGR
jgi:hypothetical protein